MSGKMRSNAISIHALREEDDVLNPLLMIVGALFQSTPSARRTTVDALCFTRRYVISIHALREEDDNVPR